MAKRKRRFAPEYHPQLVLTQIRQSDEIPRLSNKESKDLHVQHVIQFGQCMATLRPITFFLIQKRLIGQEETIGVLRQFLVAQKDVLIELCEIRGEHIDNALIGIERILTQNAKGILPSNTCLQLLEEIDKELGTIPSLIESIKKWYGSQDWEAKD